MGTYHFVKNSVILPQNEPTLKYYSELSHFSQGHAHLDGPTNRVPPIILLKFQDFQDKNGGIRQGNYRAGIYRWTWKSCDGFRSTSAPSTYFAAHTTKNLPIETEKAGKNPPCPKHQAMVGRGVTALVFRPLFLFAPRTPMCHATPLLFPSLCNPNLVIRETLPTPFYQK